MPSEPMDPLTKCLLGGVGASVFVSVVAYLVSYDEGSPVYVSHDNGPLFTVWLVSLVVGVVLMVARQWVLGAAWILGTGVSIVGSYFVAFAFLLA